jgi:hypothetical protein
MSLVDSDRRSVKPSREICGRDGGKNVSKGKVNLDELMEVLGNAHPNTLACIGGQVRKTRGNMFSRAAPNG